MDITQSRIDWHNAETLLPKPHIHKFEQKMSADPANDDVYWYAACECGATEE